VLWPIVRRDARSITARAFNRVEPATGRPRPTRAGTTLTDFAFAGALSAGATTGSHPRGLRLRAPRPSRVLRGRGRHTVTGGLARHLPGRRSAARLKGDANAPGSVRGRALCLDETPPNGVKVASDARKPLNSSMVSVRLPV
jgi:hypothetical protein